MSKTETPRRTSRDLEQAVVGRVALAHTEPIWMGDRFPPVRHRRRDCSRMSAAGQTTIIAVHPLSGSSVCAELCPCGAFRERFDGKPARRWEFRNKALDDPTWFTRLSRPSRQVPCNAAGGEAEVGHADTQRRRRRHVEGQRS